MSLESNNDRAVSPAAMRIVAALVGRPPQAMADLVKATGVTRTAIIEQLNQLVSLDFVERSSERTGRGRPRYVYTTTEKALRELFGTHERFLAAALMGALNDLGDETIRREVLDRLGGMLADELRARSSDGTLGERLSKLVESLRLQGVVVDLHEEPDRWLLHERSCPFIHVVDRTRTVCKIEERMLGEVLGHSVELVSCRLDDCDGCVFAIDKAHVHGTDPIAAS